MMKLNHVLPAILFAAAIPVWAQTSTGDILGTISDASGAAVGDARCYDQKPGNQRHTPVGHRRLGICPTCIQALDFGSYS